MNDTRTLTRDSDHGMIAGVCAGLGSYFQVDPTLIRALFVAGIVVSGFGPALYLALWILLDDVPPVSPLREPIDLDTAESRTEVGPVSSPDAPRPAEADETTAPSSQAGLGASEFPAP